MNSVIVTGATGFIGRHLVKKLKSQSEVEIIELNRSVGDISESATWELLPSVDVVIHLAARCFIDESWDDVAGFMQSNLQGTVQALNYCRSNGSHMIYLSSYLYGNPVELPVDETAALSVNNPYSFSKKLAEEACRFYSEYYDLPVTVLRPFNVYGPGQSNKFIVPSLLEQIASGTNIRVKDLNLRRDYLYVNDLVDAIILALANKNDYSVYNIGSGESYSGKELIDIIQKYKGSNLPVISESIRKKNEILNMVADISKAKKELSWEPKWSLSQGIDDMINNQWSMVHY